MRRGYVYAKGKRLYLAWYDASGARRLTAAGLSVGQEAEAEKRLAALQARAERERAVSGGGPVTVASWADEWIKAREERGIASAKDDRQRLRLYIKPALGRVALRELDDRQVEAFVRALEKRKSRMGGTLSPRTVLHIYATLRQMMKAAVKAKLIAASPCTLEEGELPELDDKDPEWRDGARFTREELEILISHPDIPESRRLGYAMMGLGGMRWCEVAALRWRHYDTSLEPLGRLSVLVSFSDRRGSIGRTKTRGTRLVPVHPVLASMLAAWRLPRQPDAEDLIIPGTKRETRRTSLAYRDLQRDLVTLGLRPRRLHDLRSTMISIAQDDGAPREVVRQITHTRDKRDVLEGYTKRQWATLCNAVSGMQIELRRGEVIELRQVANAATALLPLEDEKTKAPKSLRKSGPKLVGDAGFEPATPAV